MLERELFQGLMKAGGFFLLVKGIYLHSLWVSNNLVYQGYHSYNWLAPSALMFMGIMLLVGSNLIARFAYGNYDGAWRLSSILRMGMKLLGVWLIYRQLILLASAAEYWRMSRLIPDMVLSAEGTYWIIQLVTVIAALAAGLVFLGFQPQFKSNRGGV